MDKSYPLCQESQIKTNSLVLIFIDIFSYILWLKKHCITSQPDVDEVKIKLETLIDTCAQKIISAGIDLRDFDDARFAVLAWVDETILNMPWSQRDKWRHHLLQSKYYNTVNAGTEYFEKLNSIKSNKNNVREIYFLCSGLGFKGRYLHQSDEVRLKKIRQSNLQVLIEQIPGLPADLSDYSNIKLFRHVDIYNNIAVEKVERNLISRYFVTTSILPLLVVALFFVYSIVLSDVADNILLHVLED